MCNIMYHVISCITLTCVINLKCEVFKQKCDLRSFLPLDEGAVVMHHVNVCNIEVFKQKCDLRRRYPEPPQLWLPPAG